MFYERFTSYSYFRSTTLVHLSETIFPTGAASLPEVQTNAERLSELGDKAGQHR